jgi:hypothetical protein
VPEHPRDIASFSARLRVDKSAALNLRKLEMIDLENTIN